MNRANTFKFAVEAESSISEMELKDDDFEDMYV